MNLLCEMDVAQGGRDIETGGKGSFCQTVSPARGLSDLFETLDPPMTNPKWRKYHLIIKCLDSKLPKVKC